MQEYLKNKNSSPFVRAFIRSILTSCTRGREIEIVYKLARPAEGLESKFTYESFGRRGPGDRDSIGRNSLRRVNLGLLIGFNILFGCVTGEIQSCAPEDRSDKQYRSRIRRTHAFCGRAAVTAKPHNT